MFFGSFDAELMVLASNVMEHDVEPKRKLYETSRFTTEVAKTEVGSSTVINTPTPRNQSRCATAWVMAADIAARSTSSIQ